MMRAGAAVADLQASLFTFALSRVGGLGLEIHIFVYCTIDKA